MGDYKKLPSKAQVKPTPFELKVAQSKLSQMIDLIKVAPIAPATYENSNSAKEWGMQRDWLSKARDHWLNSYDWRKSEARINSYPNYKVEVTDDDGQKYDMHFIALFSDKEDAIPIGFFHGWPGSFLEFLDMLDVIKAKYKPADLPYHIIVPSLPGYTLSGGPDVGKDCSRIEMGRICGKLMHLLGFGDGYVAQGGDLGSFVSQHLARFDDACKAYHLNMFMTAPPKNMAELEITDLEKKAAGIGQAWQDTGTAYGQEHGTRTGTIGLVLSSSPVALLAWIGEKFLEWTDEDPPVDKVLESVSLYWLTDTISRCLYPYRSIYGHRRHEIQAQAKLDEYSQKPLGFSWFPKELIPTPISWIKAKTNLVQFERHEHGGHFAAMENPRLLLEDVEAFVKIAWKSGNARL